MAFLTIEPSGCIMSDHCTLITLILLASNSGVHCLAFCREKAVRIIFRSANVDHNLARGPFQHQMAYFNYNVLPASRSEALGEILGFEESGHISCLYQPLQNASKVISSRDLKCTGCPGYYSKYCRTLKVPTEEMKWICKFCNSQNVWQQHMQLEDDGYTSAEDSPITSLTSSTIIVIDTNCEQSELDSLKSSIKRLAAGLLPQRFALVSLDGHANVTIHNSSANVEGVTFSMSRLKVENNLKGLKEDYFLQYVSGIKNSLWLDTNSDIEQALAPLISDQSSEGKKRPKRATGLAIFVASVLSNLCDAPRRCHIMLFLSGPCTKGPGKVITRDRRFYMRQQSDFNAHKTKYFSSAKQFYKSISEKYGLPYEFFFSSLDQVGITEMVKLIDTSTVAQQFDSFTDIRFKASISSYIELRKFHAIYDPRIKILTSDSLLIDGALACLEKENPDTFCGKTKFNYSDTPRGVSNTNNWTFKSSCILNPMIFNVPISFTPSTSAKKREAEINSPEYIFIQFQLRYIKGSRKYSNILTSCLPTTNCPHLFEDSIARSFRSDVQVTFLMKQLSYEILKKGTYTDLEARAMLDSLDKLSIGKYRKCPEEAFFKYIYHLRKTPILSLRNVSPDERTLYLYEIMNASLQNCLLFCCPKIIQFKAGEPTPLELSQDQLSNPHAIFMDGGDFLGLRYTASQDNDTSMAKMYAVQQFNLVTRFPKPKFIETKAGGSQDRFFKSKLIPTDMVGNHILHTQDMSFRKFTETLSKLSLSN